MVSRNGVPNYGMEDLADLTWHVFAGTVIKYGSLINTMSIDHLADSMGDRHLQKICKPLYYSSTNVIGVGIRGERPGRIGDKCWVCLSYP